MKIFEIPGKPIAWKRARRCGNRYFDIQSKDKERLKDIISIAGKAIYSHDIALKVEIGFFMPIPKSWSKGKRLKAENENTPHISRPDLDNLAKFVLDSLNGVVWTDDAQIYNLCARKVYSPNPRTVINVDFME